MIFFCFFSFFCFYLDFQFLSSDRPFPPSLTPIWTAGFCPFVDFFFWGNIYFTVFWLLSASCPLYPLFPPSSCVAPSIFLLPCYSAEFPLPLNRRSTASQMFFLPGPGFSLTRDERTKEASFSSPPSSLPNSRPLFSSGPCPVLLKLVGEFSPPLGNVWSS